MKHFNLVTNLILGMAMMSTPFAFGAAPPTKAESCYFDLEPGATRVEWTAYKFNEKKGVNGSFEVTEVMVEGMPKHAKTVDSLLESIRFKIDTATVKTGDPARDSNIATGFFRKMVGGTVLNGKLKVAKKMKNRVDAELKVGGKTRTIPLVYTLSEKGDLEATGSADILALGLKTSFDFLQSLCRELHKGADGESKLWPNVDIRIKATVRKVCE